MSECSCLLFADMAQRVPKAFGHANSWDGDIHLQIGFHAAILLSVVSVLYLLMETTKKISLLIGVLHLSESSMGEVLAHMDMVKSLRNRIKSTLKRVSLVRNKKNPRSGQT